MTKAGKIKLIAAMSGGVDSSVAAALCAEAGYEVHGVTLRLKPEIPGCSSYGNCGGIDDESSAKQAADIIGIPHEVIDLRNDFTELVLKPCWLEYSHARTPNPCALCNRFVKFGKILEYAKEIGASGIITGHYVKKIMLPDGQTALERGDDPVKDQTYFLFSLTREELASSFFPLGAMTKTEVKAKAAAFGFHAAKKPESQDACFSNPGECFAETLRKFFNASAPGGNFIDKSGKILGRHNGIYNFTIGQRKGLGIALGKPAYVSRIDEATGDVTLCTDEAELLASEAIVNDVNFHVDGYEMREFDCLVQIRYRSAPVKAHVVPSGNSSVKVVFESPRRAVTPGQAAVFYNERIMLGGGWLAS